MNNPVQTLDYLLSQNTFVATCVLTLRPPALQQDVIDLGPIVAKQGGGDVGSSGGNAGALRPAGVEAIVSALNGIGADPQIIRSIASALPSDSKQSESPLHEGRSARLLVTFTWMGQQKPNKGKTAGSEPFSRPRTVRPKHLDETSEIAGTLTSDSG
jgi:hypothetical protein